MEKILVLSASVDNMAPQLGFNAQTIIQGNYKNIREIIVTLKKEDVAGVVIDGTLPHEETILPIIVALRQADLRDSNKKRVIILCGEKNIEGAKNVPNITELQKEFKLLKVA